MRKIIILLTLLILPFTCASDYGVHWEDTSTNVNFYTGNLTNLSQMQDVNTPSPSNDEFLTWESATSTWIAKSFADVNKWIVDTTNGFFYTDVTTLYFNDTLLNNTIDDRAVTTETDPVWLSEKSDYYLDSNPDGFISSYTETDPVWTSDKTDYSTTAEIIAFGYYNSSLIF